MSNSKLGYTVNRKNGEGKFEKVSTLFANADGTYGNKKDGFELVLSGKFPDLKINGEQYGKTFENTSKTTGTKYFLAKHEDGDLFIFQDKPRAAGSFAKKPFQKK